MTAKPMTDLFAEVDDPLMALVLVGTKNAVPFGLASGHWNGIKYA